ncbi:hypothetical protein H310_06864 [Aphanomyces invadans]|uniref:Uncharacterized protein n=1 Tax=Aphanomyces invadans TaxID=157072 RepID=A0A024U4W4_9STRA|nr:hypothetical protein H310_06864 [Aphanomyces invadans]ETW01299.1 hypothetical protein H310_06864 [Aphanomyces invadans]|eukprot:XP_008870297.1 hypothetical protein H310_06864 [Aphanomyces invadans]
MGRCSTVIRRYFRSHLGHYPATVDIVARRGREAPDRSVDIASTDIPTCLAACEMLPAHFRSWKMLGPCAHDTARGNMRRAMFSSWPVDYQPRSSKDRTELAPILRQHPLEVLPFNGCRSLGEASSETCWFQRKFLTNNETKP